MFDIVIQHSVMEFDGTNILLACLAGHLTIFAFGYPYIYRAISNLSTISTILTERLKNDNLRKHYSKFIIFAFITNLFFLLATYSKTISIFSCVILFLHIIYVIRLYKIIENNICNPFELVVNKNIHQENSQFKDIKELENDITLIIDLICYAEKTTSSEANVEKYFNWLTDAAFLNFKNFNIDNYNYFTGFKNEDFTKLFSILSEVQWLNQWIVDNRKTTSSLYCIENFYFDLLEKENFIDNKNTDKQYSFQKSVKKYTLEYLKQIMLYRINNNFISNHETNYFVKLLYFILLDYPEILLKEKYEPCFSIISKMIDNNFSQEKYNGILQLIPQHRSYVFGKKPVYNDICKFHIIVMAYFVFKNQYQKLKSYMEYEESAERVMGHTLPQIPNSINGIIMEFIGDDSVFNITETFSANVSSRKYKFYILFLLLLNSKKLANQHAKNLTKIKKDDWRYKYEEKNLKKHSKFGINFSKLPFDITMSYLILKNYKEHLECFKKETELLELFEYTAEDEKFIENILHSVIIKMEKARKKLLKKSISIIAKRSFSPYRKEKYNIKNLDKLLNMNLNHGMSSIKEIEFNCQNEFHLADNELFLYKNTFEKERFLSGGYEYIPNLMDDFYSRLFNLMLKHCQQLTSYIKLPKEIENYEILSTICHKEAFLSFGFKEDNLIIKQDIFPEVLKINNKEIKISKYNYHFNQLNKNDDKHCYIMFFDTTKISIKIGEGQPVQFKDIENDEIEILDNTQTTIKLPKDQSLGYYIIQGKAVN